MTCNWISLFEQQFVVRGPGAMICDAVEAPKIGSGHLIDCGEHIKEIHCLDDLVAVHPKEGSKWDICKFACWSDPEPA